MTLKNRDSFRAQLRALLRASVHRNVQILIPMISSVAELRETRELIESLASGGGAVLVGFVIMLAVGMVFSPLGGLLGALIFRSTPPAESTVPPPPPELPA